MRRIKQYAGVLAVMALAAAGAGAGPASAATQPIRTKAQWQAALAQVKEPGSGCYHASYPSLQWHAVTCAAAPKWPVVPGPARPARSAARGGPAVIGDGSDYSAQVSGLISKATGSFHRVSPAITEKGKVGNEGPDVKNAFSLQLNSQFFSGSPACSGSSDPAACLGWQQFVYTYQSSTVGYVFMQYWLINYNATCPAGWFTYSNDCYTNSPASTLPGGPVKAKQLSKVKLSGSATAGGSDKVALTIGTGKAALVSNADSVVDLAAFWNTTEWGIFGDGGGAEAIFDADTALEARTVLKATSSSAPSCVSAGYTGETNNLNLIGTPALGKKTSPTMASEQTNAASGNSTCAVAG